MYRKFAFCNFFTMVSLRDKILQLITKQSIDFEIYQIPGKSTHPLGPGSYLNYFKIISRLVFI